MQSFRHLAPLLRIHHGADSLQQLPRELDRLNSKRAVLVCGGTLGRSHDLLDPIRSALGHRCAGVYTGVEAQSPLPAVQDAARELRRLEADSVIALGGGSAIVTARAASILLAEGMDAHKLCTALDANGKLNSPKLLAPKLAQIVIPTTPTTAIVKAGSAILDPLSGSRLALFDPKTRAQCVFLQPDLIQSAPRALFSGASLNTLTLAVEGLLSPAGDPIADALLLHSVRLLIDRLPEANRGDGLDMRSDLMLASILSGMGSDYTSAGMAIPLGHAIGARFNIDNGLGNAIVLPHVIRFNASAADAGLHKLATSFGLSRSGPGAPAESVITVLDGVFSSLGIPRRLRDAGVPRESLSELAAVCMEDWFIQSNPRRIRDASEVQQVLEAAW